MHEFQIPYCTTVWEATNEFPPGGGGGWVPPPGPCGSNRSPEPCETGWEPYPYQVPALNPCDHVEDLISDNAFKAGVNDFKTKTSDNNEWARYFRTNGFETAIESPSNSCEVEATLNTNNFAPVVCFMHTHNDDCLPIFSPGDFKTLRKLIQKHEDYNHTLLTSKFSFVLVAESGSNSTSADVYVMVIENVELFKTFCGDKVDHLSDLADLEQHYQKNYNIGRGFTTANNELEYLRFLRNIGGDDGTGIRILKANSNLSNYSLLRLNGDGTVVIAEPCIQ